MFSRAHAHIQLPEDLQTYRDDCPDARRRQFLRIDGSENELRIVTILVRSGYTDEEVVDYFDAYELPRYSEEKKPERWLLSLIKTARSNIHMHQQSRNKTDCRDYEDDGREENIRVIESGHNQVYGFGPLPYLVLRERREAEDRGDVPILTHWYQEIIDLSGGLITDRVSLRTARRLGMALREAEYVETKMLDGKRRAVVLTEKGRRAAEPVRGKWRRSLYLMPFALPEISVDPAGGDELLGTAAALHGILPDPQALVAETSVVMPRPSRPRPPISRERARRLETERLRRYERMNGAFRLTFRGNRVRYIQLLSPVEHWARGHVWEQLLVGFDAAGLPVYETVGAMTPDSLRPLLPDTWKPRDRCFAAAVELEPEGEGFRVAERLGDDGQLRPRIGIIVQSAYNFFQPLLRTEPAGQVLRVKGTDTGKRRMYHFTNAGDALVLDLTFDRDLFLNGLFDEGRLETIRKLPCGWFHMPPGRQQLVWNLLGLALGP